MFIECAVGVWHPHLHYTLAFVLEADILSTRMLYEDDVM